MTDSIRDVSPSPPRSFSSSTSSALAASLADGISSPSTPPARTRALSDLLARYTEIEDDETLDLGAGGVGSSLSRNLSDPGRKEGSSKRVKLNGVDVGLLALDLGKWVSGYLLILSVPVSSLTSLCPSFVTLQINGSSRYLSLRVSSYLLRPFPPTSRH